MPPSPPHPHGLTVNSHWIITLRVHALQLDGLWNAHFPLHSGNSIHPWEKLLAVPGTGASQNGLFPNPSGLS